jgi:hypothetical protein
MIVQNMTATHHPIGRQLAIAIFLPFPSAVLYIGLSFLFAASPVDNVFGSSTIIVTLVIWNALYVAIATHPFVGRKRFWSDWKIWVGTSVLLSGFVGSFCFLDTIGNSYACGDGKIVSRTMIPAWPWLWIGWLVAAVSLLPARSRKFLDGNDFSLPTWPKHLGIIAITASPILIFGALFQLRTIDCTPPFSGFGVFEGGLVALPLYFAFSYCLTVGLTVITILCTHPDRDNF